MNITPSNHTQALRWLLGELHGGNTFSKQTLWHWLQQANVPTTGDGRLAVDASRLQAILDYLHESEADHYDPETYPDDVNDHVYAHVLAIEEQLKTCQQPADRDGGAQ